MNSVSSLIFSDTIKLGPTRLLLEDFRELDSGGGGGGIRRLKDDEDTLGGFFLQTHALNFIFLLRTWLLNFGDALQLLFLLLRLIFGVLRHNQRQ